MAAKSAEHVVLVGDDGLGVRVLAELRELGVTVSAVCADAEAPFARAARHAEAPLVIGDPKDLDTLRAANIEGACACGLLAAEDLVNLHGALLVQSLAPEPRVVVRLFNTSLAAAIGDLVGDSVVLSATELAAPVFVEAALRGSAGHVLRVGESLLSVQEVEGTDPRLRLALAEVEVEHGEAALFPVDARRVLGIVEAEPEDTGGAIPALPVVGGVHGALKALGRVLASVADRRVAVVGALLLLLFATSALVFDRWLGVSVLDGLYFTVVTVTTTGYGDIHLLEAPAALKLYGMALMVGGGLVLAVVFALVTDAVVGARIAAALGHYPVPQRGHVVVCGIGRVGRRVIQDLVEEGVPCVAVERDEDNPELAIVKRLRVPVVVGDAGSQETFEGLRLESARALMGLTNDDVANLQCALLARARAPGLRVVLRLTDPDLAARVERSVGIDLSRSPFALAAPAFSAALLGRTPAAVIPVGAAVMQIAGVTAERATDVRTLEGGCDARVLAVDGTAFPPSDHGVAPGVEVLAVGTARGLAELERRAVPAA